MLILRVWEHGDIPSVEQVPTPQLGAANWINRDSTSGPASSAY